MNDSDLESLLRLSTVPDRDEDYWDRFPKSVLQRFGAHQRSDWPQPGRRVSATVGWGLSLAAACLCVGFAVGFWKGRPASAEARQMAALEKCLAEVGRLFPNQIRAISLDRDGPHLLLSDAADVPESSPIYLRICRPDGCQRFITFSGQQIRVNGEEFEVLSNGEGKIILLGRKLVWSSTLPTAGTFPYRIEAKRLNPTL